MMKVIHDRPEKKECATDEIQTAAGRPTRPRRGSESKEHDTRRVSGTENFIKIGGCPLFVLPQQPLTLRGLSTARSALPSL